MRIWHVGAAGSPHAVDGVNNTVWILAREQRALGHDVHLLMVEPPDDAGRAAADAAGIHVRAPDERDLDDPTRRPDVVQMYSVFVPWHARLARRLAAAGVPYVIKPAGGLSDGVLRRGRLKKAVYGTFVERPRLSGSSAIVVGTETEADEVRRYVAGYRGIVRWIPNPIDVSELEGARWTGDVAARRVVWLGRFDVVHKGLDLLVQAARLMPHVRVELYGMEARRAADEMRGLERHLPPNVAIHGPVYGSAKAAALSQASLYVQPSRWEGIARTVCEAMFLGVPCAVSETTGLYRLLGEEGAVAPLPLDPPGMAGRILELLADPVRLRAYGARGRQYAEAALPGPAVARSYVALYEEVVQDRREIADGVRGDSDQVGQVQVAGGSE